MTINEQMQLLDRQAVEEQRLTEVLATSRFGIAEWYGLSFFDLDREQRKELIDFRPIPKSKLNKQERVRLETLAAQEVAGTLSKPRDIDRLNVLRNKSDAELRGNKICPFKSTETVRALCNKPGGVCSLRLYRRSADGIISPVPIEEEQGGLRATCPNRFHESHKAFKWVGETILGQPSPDIAVEVGFLESEQTVDSDEGADVGRLDMILVDTSKPRDHPMMWAALEIQAVYFSGKGMAKEFSEIEQDIDQGGSGIIWPTEVRRPDYRSSGPKRLMPQLQIKVPTLRRWGKKMAVVVDRSFYKSIGTMETVSELSNADIAWFVLDFELVPGENRFKIKPAPVYFTTLEESVKGLTGGRPIAQGRFEDRIRAKLNGNVTPS
ncbi:NotI family restriction endonuclease [Noviherbaspirillum sp.]|uniref:NotI family restriction endonuclease n=1 Tax=Noviherbaspirillum sp. TaxID=1926288 RepID=UPI002FDFFB04